MERYIDLSGGRVYVVSDLHGAWEPYARYRDDFLTLHAAGRADILVFLGDIIHSYGPPETDYSLEMLLDLMQLQEQLGTERVIMLVGNHELPHIYGVTLSKGDNVFTPRFEHTLGSYRKSVVKFLKSLPFMVRTPAGVLLTHAGASPATAHEDTARRLETFSHEAVLDEVDRLLQRQDVNDLLQAYGQQFGGDYTELAWEYLAARPDDPRFLDLLRGFLASNLEPEWTELWELFFTQCERQHTAFYRQILARFLDIYSMPGLPQRIMVSGHIQVSGCYEIVARRQFRLASWAHAHPPEEGAALLFDAGETVSEPSDLVENLRPLSSL